VVDRDAPVPPYEQIADILRAQIMRGELKPGQRVPSVMKLADAYDVSRPTAQRALDVLKREGLVKGRPGWGTFVSEPPRQP
jgi:DNA-binding GntR family transcriptional regulator